jgi:biopolymer transport protein ExbD
MTGLPVHLVALSCVIGLISANDRVASKPSTGIAVLLPHACNSSDERRDLVVRYLPGGKLWLNEESLKEDALRSRVQERLATRVEKLLWVAADERVSYGEVVALLSKLDRDNPDTYIALTTKMQTGPIDPADPKFRDAQLNPKLGIYNLCISSIDVPEMSHFR